MTALTLADTTIRQDAHGRYCLNDLHQAAGALSHQRPSKWLANKATMEQLEILNVEAQIRASNSVRGHGITATYVVKELVYSYAMWINPAFHIKVIRTFDAVVNGEHAMPHIQSAKFWDALRPHWAPIARLALAGFKNVQIAQQVQRSVGSVGRCLRRMFDVGYLNPVAVFQARLKPATAARWAITKPVASNWGRTSESTQMCLAL